MAASTPNGASRHLVVLLLGVAVIFAVHLRSWTFLCDDAYISFRYAENLALHGVPVYNVEPVEKVEGYTNPLWVGVLAVMRRLGAAPPEVAPWLTALAALIILGSTVGALRAAQTRWSRAPLVESLAFFPALWLALTPEFVVWASSGLETSAAVAFGIASLLATLRQRWRWAGGLAAAAVLTRPDSVVWLAAAACLPLADALRSREGAQRPIREMSTGLLIFALPVVAHLLWRHAYYGAWVPNTFAVKGDAAAYRGEWGSAYLLNWLRGSGVWIFAVLLPFLRRAQLPWVLGALASLAWAWWVGGDFMAYSRFLLPATVLAALAAGGSLLELRALWMRRAPALAPRVSVLVGAFALALAVTAAWRLPARVEADEHNAWLDGRWESVTGMRTFASVRVAAGEAFARAVEPNTWASVGAAGAMPYASRLPTFDVFALVDPAAFAAENSRPAARPRPGHARAATPAYVSSRAPTLMCHVGSVGPEIPPEREARRRGGPGWGWACVATGEIDERSAPEGRMPSQWYCCLARRDGPLGDRLPDLEARLPDPAGATEATP